MIEAYQSDVEISFKVPGSIIQQVQEWEKGIDERVFHEQLRTGRLVCDEGEIHPDSFELMKKRYKKHGKIEPYYGCSGAFPSYQFHILPILTHLNLTVEHGATSEVLEFTSLPFSGGLPLPDSWNFNITGKEMDNLARWKEWVADAALSDRYIFHFFSCSIGRGATVKNTESGNEVNVTDYDDW